MHFTSPIYKVLTLTLLLIPLLSQAQEQDGGNHYKAYEKKSNHQTFKDTRVINSQSVETLQKGILDFRIGHRFGNIDGGFATFYGLENAADVIFEFDYGITDNIMIGIMRTKGAGPLTQNVSGLFKYRVLRQGSTSPFSVAFSGLASVSTVAASSDPGRITFFPVFAHRWSYNLQAIIASKITERIAFQIAPQWTYRNIVPNDPDVMFVDTNNLPSISAALKIQMNKALALIFDATIPFSEHRRELNSNGERDFFFPLGIGIEWETGGGHVFQMNFTNSTGIIETDYIPYTTSNWLDGEFRLGFTIARKFKL